MIEYIVVTEAQARQYKIITGEEPEIQFAVPRRKFEDIARFTESVSNNTAKKHKKRAPSRKPREVVLTLRLRPVTQSEFKEGRTPGTRVYRAGKACFSLLARDQVYSRDHVVKEVIAKTLRIPDRDAGAVMHQLVRDAHVLEANPHVA